MQTKNLVHMLSFLWYWVQFLRNCSYWTSLITERAWKLSLWVLPKICMDSHSSSMTKKIPITMKIFIFLLRSGTTVLQAAIGSLGDKHVINHRVCTILRHNLGRYRLHTCTVEQVLYKVESWRTQNKYLLNCAYKLVQSQIANEN